jgi:preprotein translocase subunit SecY
MAVFRLGVHITVPGVNAAALSDLENLPFLNMLNLVSGGAMQSFSIFAMGVSPYITASIVIQLLQMDIVPKFVEWAKQGEVGRKKLNQATRWLTLVLAFIQSVGITAGFNQYAAMATTKGVKLVESPSPKTFIIIGLILTAGTMFVTWMGEMITEKGIGNGVSMIIFAGIVANMPNAVKNLIDETLVNGTASQHAINAVLLVLLVIAVIAVVTIVTWFQQAERKIPIQYTKRPTGAPTSSYLPLKVNAAGVIPVIFASSFIATPNAILQFMSASHKSDGWFQVLSQVFNYNTWPGALLYTVLIVAFTFFYAFVQVNPEKMAENLQKQGSYIPGVRPGKDTENWVSALLMRLSTVGSIFLGVVALLPIAASIFIGESVSSIKGLGLGGTSLLIIVGVAIEFTKQLHGLLLKKQYIGFTD